MPEWTEPDIEINGVKLTFAQAMTVRVAVETFAISLQDNGLGKDERGKAIAAGYLARISEIHTMMMRPSTSPNQDQAFIEAQIGTLTQILATMPEDDYLGRIGLTSRLDDLKQELAKLSDDRI